MPFIPKPTKRKTRSENKSLYLSHELVERLNKVVKDYHTSFNNVVVSMIEYCLEDIENKD